MEDSYTCTLTEKEIKKAKDELNEIPSDRLSAVQALREWLLKQKHLTFNSSTVSLLRILRHAKFSQAKARETIENLAKFVSKYPKNFEDLDSHDPSIQEIMKKGQLVLLPGYDDEGRKVLIYRLNVLSPDEIKKKFAYQTLIRTWNCMFTLLFKDEKFQINGLIMFADMTGLSLKVISAMGDAEMMTYQKDAKDAQVGRMKGFHYYNVGGLFETFFALYKPYMKKKHRERIKVHETLESVYEIIPKRMLPIEYLPDDYSGPNGGKIQDIANNAAKEIYDNREYILEQTAKGIITYNENLKDKKAEEPLQHFRKLNID